MNRFSAVAIQQDYGRNWAGVVHPVETTPNDFGPVLWEHLQDNFNSLDRFSRMLLSCNSWQEYVDNGLCPYCGKHDVGAPVSIRGNLFVQVKNGILAPDKDAQFHRHVTNTPKVYANSGYKIGLWADWVYLIHPKDYTLEVLKSVITDGTHTIDIDGLLPIPQNNFRYYSLAFFSMFKEEPDWKALARHGDEISQYYFDRYRNRLSRVVKNSPY